jgi:hypothetical protein
VSDLFVKLRDADRTDPSGAGYYQQGLDIIED